MDQYIVLPSNSSLDYLPDNTLSNFKVKLAEPIRLSGRYEVALMEMIYPHLHLSVEPDEAAITLLGKVDAEQLADKERHANTNP